jgi:tRNA_anti-like
MRRVSNRELAALVFVGVAWFGIMLACSSPEQEEADVTARQPEVTVSAAQLSADYQANEVAADAQYKGKIVLITGIVDTIGKDITDRMYVSLKSGGEYSIFGVQCFFAKAHESELAQLQKGEFVAMKGKCDGKFGNVLLKGCVLAPSTSTGAPQQ